MIGDFLDPYGFYTVVEDDELKDFVKEKLESINVKLDIKLNIITNKTTLMEICQLLRALAMDNGHMLIYGTSLISAQCVVELACRIKGIRMFKLLDTDITGMYSEYIVILDTFLDVSLMIILLFQPINGRRNLGPLLKFVVWTNLKQLFLYLWSYLTELQKLELALKASLNVAMICLCSNLRSWKL